MSDYSSFSDVGCTRAEGPKGVSDADLEYVFSVLDTDCSGSIEVQELVAFLKKPKSEVPAPCVAPQALAHCFFWLDVVSHASLVVDSLPRHPADLLLLACSPTARCLRSVMPGRAACCGSGALGQASSVASFLRNAGSMFWSLLFVVALADPCRCGRCRSLRDSSLSQTGRTGRLVARCRRSGRRRR